MKLSPFLILTLFTFSTSLAQNSCDADHKVLLTEYAFSPKELVINPGESVAFINVKGTHDVNGKINTITGISFNNPAEFSLPQTIGTTEGTCAGVITFDTPGVYNFDCSIGFHAKLGMVGTITVDAYTLSDLLASQTIPESFQSSYAFNSYLGSELDSIFPYTVFVPNDLAVKEVMELMQLGQFDLLNFYDLKPALEYHIAKGIFSEEDLKGGKILPTVYGQDLVVTETDGTLKVNDAEIIATNYTADNGVVHIINKTLTPSGLPLASVWDVVEQSENHEILEYAISVTGFQNALRQQAELDPNGSTASNNGHPGPFTIFAPTDKAVTLFAQSLGMSAGEFLDSDLLDDFVSQHIVESRNESNSIFNGQNLNNLAGEDLKLDVNQSIIAVNGIELVITDKLAYNGVVHVIDAVIPFYIPQKTGSCGTYTLAMYDADGDGWNETNLFVEVDGELISTQSLKYGSSAFFEFGVDSGSMINLYSFSQNANTIGESYTLLDGNNQEVAASGQYGKAVNSIGILACAEPADCGNIKIEMKDQNGDGWGAGTLAVYINKSPYVTIPFYYGMEQITSIPANYGDVFDFECTLDAFNAEYNSYVVYGPDGSVLVDQNEISQLPQNVYDIFVCEKEEEPEIVVNPIDSTVVLYPNPANNMLNVKTSLNVTSIEIFNTVGPKIYETNNGIKNVDVSLLSEGTYFIKVYTDDRIDHRKISILH